MQTTKRKSKRIFYFDALRALAILTVIIFHVALRVMGMIKPYYGPPPTFGWLFTDFILNPLRCGVDIFLMLSGALSLGRDWKYTDFLKKRLSRIVMPFAFWLIILSSIVICASYLYPTVIFDGLTSFDPASILDFIIESAMGLNKWFVPYWFFWMILATYLIMPIFNKWIKLASMDEIEYFLIIWLITCLFDQTLFIDLPISLKYFAGSIGFVVLGYYLRYTERKIFSKFRYGLLITLISSALMIAFSYQFSSNADIFIFNRYSILNCFVVIGIFLMFRHAEKLNVNLNFFNNPEGIFRRLISAMAKYSYGIYLIHMIILNAVIILVPNTHYASYVVFVTLVSLFGSMLILSLLNRIPILNSFIGAK